MANERKEAQHHKYLKKCKLKPQDTTIHPLEWQKIKRLLKPSYDQGVEELEFSYIVNCFWLEFYLNVCRRHTGTKTSKRRANMSVEKIFFFFFALHEVQRELRRQRREKGGRRRHNMMCAGCYVIRKGPGHSFNSRLTRRFFPGKKFLRSKCLPDPSKQNTI